MEGKIISIARLGAEDMNEIKEWFAVGAAALAILGIFFEVSKIKFNPISWLFKTIGAAFNEPTIKQLQATKEEIHELKEMNRLFNQKLEELAKSQDATDLKIDVNEIKRIRAQIREFANSLKRREEHTEQQYQDIIWLHKDYESLIETTGLENGVLDEDYNFILTVYRRCRDSGKFYRDHCYINNRGLKEGHNEQVNS